MGSKTVNKFGSDENVAGLSIALLCCLKSVIFF